MVKSYNIDFYKILKVMVPKMKRIEEENKKIYFATENLVIIISFEKFKHVTGYIF